MMKAIKKNWMFFLHISILVIGLVIAFVYESQIENQFPIWENPEDITVARIVQSDEVVIKVGSTKLDKFKDSDSGISMGHLIFDVENTSSSTTLNSWCHWVEYFHQGGWHAVYIPRGFMARGWEILPNETYPIMLIMPNDLFSVPGKYRFAVEGIGYCEFSVDEQLQLQK